MSLQKKTPSLGKTENLKAADIKVPVKFFDPTGAGTWYVIEANWETGEAFGFVEIHSGCGELGYFDLNELAATTVRWGLGIECDTSWNPQTTLDEVLKMHGG